jgi:hypothetical protein
MKKPDFEEKMQLEEFKTYYGVIKFISEKIMIVEVEGIDVFQGPGDEIPKDLKEGDKIEVTIKEHRGGYILYHLSKDGKAIQ